MPSLLQIVILALVQGVSELLPVSSSAHVILLESLMGLDPGSPPMTLLLVMLHTGTNVFGDCVFLEALDAELLSQHTRVWDKSSYAFSSRPR